ncbi:MAG: hydroxymethylbilane synthase [Ardenticatenales bacterium]
MRERFVLATRGSALARAQATQVADALRAAWPGVVVEPLVVRTQGDDITDRSVAEIGQGVFVGEVQRAVLDGRADIAVHSYKDLPTAQTDGLRIAAVPEREDARDCLVSLNGRVMTYMPPGARIGTGSARRRAQLLRRNHALSIEPIRGNVDTRLGRVAEGDLDGIVLAAAGLRRLGLAGRITEAFDTDVMVPAPAQGALALEVRHDDLEAGACVAALHDAWTGDAVTAERTCLALLGGGCHAPIGIHAVTDGETVALVGIVSLPDGSKSARLRWRAPSQAPAEAGSILADLLMASGAGAILAEIERGRPA